MASYLITETMARRHQLSMASFDRLFPNQDTLPNGGFGNLIARPPQHHPRLKGNTLFLNDKLEPFADRWNFLSALPRIAIAKVEGIAMDAAKRGQLVGLRTCSTMPPPTCEPSRTDIHSDTDPSQLLADDRIVTLQRPGNLCLVIPRFH